MEYPSRSALFQIFRSHTLWVFQGPTTSIDYHQIFWTCSASNVLGCIRHQRLQWQHFALHEVICLVAVPLTKPMRTFTSNFQDGFTSKGSKSNQVLGSIWQQLLPWHHFQLLGVLYILISLWLKSMHEFHQIFNIPLPSQDLFLSSNNCCHSNTGFVVLKILNSYCSNLGMDF